MRVHKLITIKQRNFLVVLIGASISLWNICFEIGAWGQIFYTHFFYLWILSMSIGITAFIFPTMLSSLSTIEKIALAFPSAWLALSITSVTSLPQLDWLNNILYIGLVISLLCLPFMCFVILTLLDPETDKLNNDEIIKLLILLTLICLSAYFSGKYNALFMNCNDFIVAGSSAPPTCSESSPLESIFDSEKTWL